MLEIFSVLPLKACLSLMLAHSPSQIFVPSFLSFSLHTWLLHAVTRLLLHNIQPIRLLITFYWCKKKINLSRSSLEFAS